MDGFHLFYDTSTGLFRYTDDADEDSGVEDLPFSLYSSGTYGSINTSAETSLCNNSNDADDDDLTYIDDIRDGDYRPHKSAYVPKKGKRQYRRHQINGRTCLSQLITPEKQQHGLYNINDVGEEGCQIRHYARKDRTPNTILKMMERHRESERVRHHTLNESMKDVCLRIPGYDPDVKETKVIQMQRIIAYECFLENTLTSVCEKLGMNPRSLKMSTNLITDAMKNTPIEEFYQPSSYRTSDAEDEDQHVPVITQVKPKTSAHGSKVLPCIFNEKTSQQYRQEKISSPTIDSTTSDLIKVLPLSPVPQMPGYQLFGNGCFPAQCFIPINNSANNLESSQESGIKVEGTQSTVHEEDSHFHENFGPLIDQSAPLEPAIPSFMKEDLNTSATTNPDSEQMFDLSSPVRHHGKVFLQSPKPIGFWSKQGRSCFLGKADTPIGKEMQTVSPENVLETKAKYYSNVTQSTSSSKVQMIKAVPVTDIFHLTTDQIIHAAQNSSEIQYVCDHQGRQFSTYKILSGISKENGCIKVQHIYIPKFENGVMKLDSPENSCKNKRKRYTPLKSMEELEDECVESEEEDFDGMSSLCGETTDTDIEEHGTDSEMEQSQPVPQLPVPQMGQYPYGFPQNWGYPAPAPCRGQGKKVKYAKPLVDHRKSTWMNGFMMFSKLNRPKYTSENPGVHTSQIQRMMGEAWRKLTAEEKQPYKDQAKEWCERMKEAGVHENQGETGGKAKRRRSNKTKSEKDSGNSSLAKALDQIKSIAEATKEKQSDSAKEKQSDSESHSSKSDTVNGTESPEKDS